MITSTLAGSFSSAPTTPPALLSNSSSSRAAAWEEYLQVNQLKPILERYEIVVHIEENNKSSLPSFESETNQIVAALAAKAAKPAAKELLLRAIENLPPPEQVCTLDYFLCKPINGADLAILLLWGAVYKQFPKERMQQRCCDPVSVRNWFANNRVATIKEVKLNDCRLFNLPQELGIFTGITTLHLAGNHLGREIEKLASLLAKLKHLKYLDIGDNEINNLKWLEKLRKLQVLDISFNSFKTGFPVKMHRLELLNVLIAYKVPCVSLILKKIPNLRRLAIDEGTLKRNFKTVLAVPTLATLIVVKKDSNEKLDLTAPNARKSLKAKISRPADKLKKEGRSFPDNHTTFCEKRAQEVWQSYFALSEKTRIRKILMRLMLSQETTITEEVFQSLEAKLIRLISQEDRKPLVCATAGLPVYERTAVLNEFLSGKLDKHDIALLLLWRALDRQLPQNIERPRSYDSHQIRKWCESNARTLAKVTALDLNDCGLTLLPMEFLYFRSLTSLNLSKNSLRHVSQITKYLQCIEKNGRKYKQAERIIELNISGNQIEDLKKLAEFCSLEKADISDNPATMRLPLSFVRLKGLNELLMANVIYGDLLAGQIYQTKILTIDASTFARNYGLILSLPNLQIVHVADGAGLKTFKMQTSEGKKAVEAYFEGFKGGLNPEIAKLERKEVDSSYSIYDPDQEAEDWNEICKFQEASVLRSMYEGVASWISKLGAAGEAEKSKETGRFGINASHSLKSRTKKLQEEEK